MGYWKRDPAEEDYFGPPSFHGKAGDAANPVRDARQAHFDSDCARMWTAKIKDSPEVGRLELALARAARRVAMLREGHPEHDGAVKQYQRAGDALNAYWLARHKSPMRDLTPPEPQPSGSASR